MIVGNCCANCQRHQSNNASSSSPPKSPSGGAVLATSFRRPNARRVRFEAPAAAPSLPQRIRASAVGLARAAIAAPPTSSSTTDTNALSAFASQGTTSKVVASSTLNGDAQSAWSQSAAVRPYWEQESCSSVYGDGSAAFRSPPSAMPGYEMQQRSFDSFAAQQEPLGLPAKVSADKHWRDEFLREAATFTASSSTELESEQLDTTLRTITQSEQWNNGLRTVVKRILPDAERLFDDLKADTKADNDVEAAMDDAKTVKRLRMILQHLAYAPSCAAMLSVR